LSKNYLLSIKFIMICALLFSTPLACSVPTKAVDLTFRSVEQSGSVVSVNLYEAKGPELKIIAQLAEVDSLDRLITDDARQKLLALDYNRYFALAAFFGLQPTTGYSIQVNRVSRIGNTVSVYALLDIPGTDEAKANEVTSPYHLVIVQKDGSWGKAISFALIANHMLFFSVSHDIP